MVVTTSPRANLYKKVVFPEQSRPKNRILWSVLWRKGKMRSKKASRAGKRVIWGMQFQDQWDTPLCMYARRGELDTFMTALEIRGVRCELMLSCLTPEFLTEVTRENLTCNFWQIPALSARTSWNKTVKAYPNVVRAQICPRYKDLAADDFYFLRTYSARIYFIETNSSLAILQLPHPSNPLDDICALSFDREHDFF